MKAGDTFGEYRILRRLGYGGQGAVFEVEDALGCSWALKVGHKLQMEDPQAEARFVKEAQWVSVALNQLPRNAGVLVGEHYGLHEGRFYVKMRLLRGESLAARLARAGALSEAETIEIGAAVAEAVATAHLHEALHRDLKPENVFIEEDGKVQVLDWGCLQLTEVGRSGETQPGPMCTLGYAALEQYRRPLQLGPETDVYSLGVMLLEMITGYHPFLGWSRKQHSAAPPVSGLPSTVVFGNLATGLAKTAPPSEAHRPSASSARTVRRLDQPPTDDPLRGEVATRDTPATERLDSGPWGAAARRPGESVIPPTRTARRDEQPQAVGSLPEVIERQRRYVPKELSGVSPELARLLAEMMTVKGDKRLGDMTSVARRLRRLQRPAHWRLGLVMPPSLTGRPLKLAFVGTLLAGVSLLGLRLLGELPHDGDAADATTSGVRPTGVASATAIGEAPRIYGSTGASGTAIGNKPPPPRSSEPSSALHRAAPTSSAASETTEQVPTKMGLEQGAPKKAQRPTRREPPRPSRAPGPGKKQPAPIFGKVQ